MFSNSTSTGLKGNLESNGLTYAMPFPVMVWCGIKDVLLDFSANDTIPVLPSNIHTLFLEISGIEICCMHNHLEANDVCPNTISYGHLESQTSALIWMTWLSNFKGISIQKWDSIITPV